VNHIVWSFPRAVVLCCSALVFCQSGQAQQPTDLSTLKKQIDTLERQQRLILKKLDELVSGSPSQSGMNPTALTATEIGGEVFKGEAGAKVAVIEYADFECPFCGQYERDTFPQVSKNYIETGKIKYLYRDLPLHHPHAMAAARASHCAGDQGKYWNMHDTLFANQANLADDHLSELAGTLGLDAGTFTKCLAGDKFTDQIQASVAGANKLGINATPAFVIGTLDKDGKTVKINKRIIGAVGYDTLKTELDAALASVPPTRTVALKP
jgi:protein-disulfide isomerase